MKHWCVLAHASAIFSARPGSSRGPLLLPLARARACANFSSPLSSGMPGRSRLSAEEAHCTKGAGVGEQAPRAARRRGPRPPLKTTLNGTLVFRGSPLQSPTALHLRATTCAACAATFNSALVLVATLTFFLAAGRARQRVFPTGGAEYFCFYFFSLAA